jgi:hypothetical protein
MSAFDATAEGWLLSAMLLIVPLLFALPDQEPPDARRSWLLALIALSAPLFCPTRGVPSTVVTGFGVIVATRLPDLRTRPRDESGLSRLLWFYTPIVRSVPTDAARRAANRRRALPFLGRALVKRLCWEPLGFALTHFDPDRVPAALKTVVLVAYFVLNLTALADVALGLARLLGADTDELFDWPLLSTSPREFWSRRWNRYISRFALRHVARPLQARFPRAVVTLAVFAASALFHEYFAYGASGPATRPGAMTAFFVVQGIAVLVGERFPPPRGTPRWLRHLGTVVWMLLTAPWFFTSLRPALTDFGFPAAWLP